MHSSPTFFATIDDVPDLCNLLRTIFKEGDVGFLEKLGAKFEQSWFTYADGRVSPIPFGTIKMSDGQLVASAVGCGLPWRKWESLDLREGSEHDVFYFFPSVTGKIEIDTLIKQTADTFTANMNKHWPEAFSSVDVTLSYTVSSMCSTERVELAATAIIIRHEVYNRLVDEIFSDDLIGNSLCWEKAIPESIARHHWSSPGELRRQCVREGWLPTETKGEFLRLVTPKITALVDPAKACEIAPEYTSIFAA